MGSILSVLISTIKAQITPIVTKIKMWTSWNFIRTQLISRLRDFFNKILNVRPRDKKDYYSIFGWLVSKRLAYAVVAVVGVISLYYLVNVVNILPTADGDTIKTYSYNSLMLRFTDGTVRILAKDGHVAYEGEVADGAVTGQGTLYNVDGVVVYEGKFEDNQYDGSGSLYYEDGSLMYVGDFSDNEFDGDGKLYYEDGTLEYEGSFTKGKMDGSGVLYRENGTLEYEGDFTMGVKSGNGSLYDMAGTRVYDGTFSRDEVVYSELLGEKVSDVWSSYSGSRKVYEQDEEYAVVLEDIDVLYANDAGANTLDDEITVDQVIVLKDSIKRGDNTLSTIADLNEYFGISAGRTRELTFAETIAMYLTAPEYVSIFSSDIFDDYTQVEDYSASATVHVYTAGGLKYTFVSPQGSDAYAFYIIEKGGDEG